MRKFGPRFSECERLENRAANAIGRKSKNRSVRKTEAELRAFIFGTLLEEVETTKVAKTKSQVISENCDKYNLIAQGFCTIVINGESFNGRFSKEEINKKQKITEDSVINFYVFKCREYMNTILSEVEEIRAHGDIVKYS
jgi:hypothetical protein